MDLTDRHSGVQSITKYFSYDHLEGRQRSISKECSNLAIRMLQELDDSPELTEGLRKLLEAKDCFVRASLDL